MIVVEYHFGRAIGNVDTWRPIEYQLLPLAAVDIDGDVRGFAALREQWFRLAFAIESATAKSLTGWRQKRVFQRARTGRQVPESWVDEHLLAELFRLCTFEFGLTNGRQILGPLELVLASMCNPGAARAMFDTLTIDAQVAATGIQKDLLRRCNFDAGLSTDQFQHLFGDHFDVVVLCLDLDLAAGGKQLHAGLGGKQTDLPSYTGKEAFAGSQRNVAARCRRHMLATLQMRSRGRAGRDTGRTRQDQMWRGEFVLRPAAANRIALGTHRRGDFALIRTACLRLLVRRVICLLLV